MGSVRIIPTVFSTCCFVFVNAGSDQDFIPRLEGGVIQLTEPFAEPGEPFTWVLETDVGLTIAGQPTVTIDSLTIINPTITFDPEYTKDSITLRLQADNCESSFDRVQINTVLNSFDDHPRVREGEAILTYDSELYVGELFNTGAPYTTKYDSSGAVFLYGYRNDSNTIFQYREWTSSGWTSWVTIPHPVAPSSTIPALIHIRAINSSTGADYITEAYFRINKNAYRYDALTSSASRMAQSRAYITSDVTLNPPPIFFIRESEYEFESHADITSAQTSRQVLAGYQEPFIFYSRVTPLELESFQGITSSKSYSIIYAGYVEPQFFYSGQSGV